MGKSVPTRRRLTESIVTEASSSQSINFIVTRRQTTYESTSDAVRDYVEEIAERAVQLGGVASGKARMAAQRSTLKEYPATAVDCREHVEALSSALAAFGKTARKGIDEANAFGDLDTADLFTQVSRGIDKWLWFVEAHAQSKR